MTSPLTYLKHVRDEFAHINWPSRRTAVAHTLLVVAIAAALAIAIGLFDRLLEIGVGMITRI